MNYLAQDIENARLQIVLYINRLQSKNKCSRNKAVILFLKKYELEQLPENLVFQINEANRMRQGTISKATLYRWCQTVDKKKSLKPKLIAKEKQSASFCNNLDALFYYSQLWYVCQRDHKSSVDWLIEEKLKTLEFLDLGHNAERFLWRVTVGEILLDYISRKQVSRSSIINDFSRVLAEGYLCPFPIGDQFLIDKSGINLKQERLDEGIQSVKNSLLQTLEASSDYYVKSLNRMAAIYENVYNVDSGYISYYTAEMLFGLTKYPFYCSSQESISKTLKNWIYEAQVTEHPIKKDGKSEYNDIKYLCYQSRLNPLLELPLSKKKMRDLISSGVSIKGHIEKHGFDCFSQS